MKNMINIGETKMVIKNDIAYTIHFNANNRCLTASLNLAFTNKANTEKPAVEYGLVSARTMAKANMIKANSIPLDVDSIVNPDDLLNCKICDLMCGSTNSIDYGYSYYTCHDLKNGSDSTEAIAGIRFWNEFVDDDILLEMSRKDIDDSDEVEVSQNKVRVYHRESLCGEYVIITVSGDCESNLEFHVLMKADKYASLIQRGTLGIMMYIMGLPKSPYDLRLEAKYNKSIEQLVWEDYQNV